MDKYIGKFSMKWCQFRKRSSQEDYFTIWLLPFSKPYIILCNSIYRTSSKFFYQKNCIFKIITVSVVLYFSQGTTLEVGLICFPCVLPNWIFLFIFVIFNNIFYLFYFFTIMYKLRNNYFARIFWLTVIILSSNLFFHLNDEICFLTDTCFLKSMVTML